MPYYAEHLGCPGGFFMAAFTGMRRALSLAERLRVALIGATLLQNVKLCRFSDRKIKSA